MNKWIVILFCLIGLTVASSGGHFAYEDPATSLYPVNIREDAHLDVIRHSVIAADPTSLGRWRDDSSHQKYGYPAENHTVITKDGYILGLDRIPHGRDQNNDPSADRPSVLLMHALLSSSSDWVDMGPSMSLGYILAETGYDVWMGNARGNYYSRDHVLLSPTGISRRAFWDFSWHEIGTLDLPAIIDYILSVTGQSAIHYIGHSQGTTAFFVMASLFPEYNDKIIAVQALAPVVYMEHVLNPSFRSLGSFASAFEIDTTLLGINEFVPNDEILTWAGRQRCYAKCKLTELCENVVFLLADSNDDNINATMVPVIMGHTPAGASNKQFAHYGQLVNSHQFQQWDFGNLGNLVEYGRWTPPNYPLERVSAPVALHYSAYDINTEIRDVRRLDRELGNSLGIFELPVKNFSHLDFIWGYASEGSRLRTYDGTDAVI